jgi:hypothetical protein
MKLSQPILSFFVALTIAAAAFAQSSTPAQKVAAFYKFDETHDQTFNRANIDARQRYIDSSLYLLLQKELEREAEFLRANPGDKPHFGDGLPFRPLDETCTVGTRSYRYRTSIGRAQVVGETATVPVTFSYPPACKLPGTVFKVKLYRAKARWVIQDFEYPDGRTLSQDLSRASY